MSIEERLAEVEAQAAANAMALASANLERTKLARKVEALDHRVQSILEELARIGCPALDPERGNGS